MGRKRTAIHFDTPLSSSDDEHTPQPDITLRDTVLELLSEGRRLASTRHIPNTASPRKKTAIRRTEPVWLDQGPLPELTLENYPFLDPDYVQFLDGIDEPSPKRAKTAFVSIHLYTCTFLANPMTGRPYESLVGRSRHVPG